MFLSLFFLVVNIKIKSALASSTDIVSIHTRWYYRYLLLV